MTRIISRICRSYHTLKRKRKKPCATYSTSLKSCKFANLLVTYRVLTVYLLHFICFLHWILSVWLQSWLKSDISFCNFIIKGHFILFLKNNFTKKKKSLIKDLQECDSFSSTTRQLLLCPCQQRALQTTVWHLSAVPHRQHVDRL